MADTRPIPRPPGITPAQVRDVAETMTQDAVEAQQRVERLRQATQAVQAQRDALVRRVAAMPGTDRSQLAKRLGLSRASLYSILNGDGVRDEAIANDALQAESEARRRWAAAGRIGEPDDFWPLE